MLDASQPAPVRWIRELFAENGKFASRTVVTIGEFLDDFSLGPPQGLNAKYAARALKAEGFKQGPRIKIGGDARQLWLRDTSGTGDELRERYLAELRCTGVEGLRLVVRDTAAGESTVRDQPSRKNAA
jgi:hypothetical protein